MEPSDHMSLKTSVVILWFLDALVFTTIIALFVEEHMKSYVMFATIIFVSVSFSVKLVYFIQGLQEHKRNDQAWNHTVEVFPLVYCFFSQIVTIIVTIVAILKALDMTLIDAFAKLDVETLYLVIILWTCHVAITGITLRMFSIHRQYSCDC